MLTDFRYTFFNPGERIDELMRFSISSSSAGFNNESNDKQSVGFWSLNARAESFFDVPADITSGNEVVRVNFADDIKARFGKRGVVLVDARWAPEKEDPDKEVSEYPIAPTKEAAIERGNEIRQIYLRKLIEQHLADCDNARSAGGAPRAATGFTKKAFKLLGIADPGEQYFAALKEGKSAAATSQNTDILLEMQRSNQAMMGIVLAIASGQKIDPELLKAVVPQGKAPTMPVTSGIGTGEIKKPVVFDPKKSGLDGVPVETKTGQVGLDAYDRKPQGRKDRVAAAKNLVGGD